MPIPFLDLSTAQYCSMGLMQCLAYTGKILCPASSVSCPHVFSAKHRFPLSQHLHMDYSDCSHLLEEQPGTILLLTYVLKEERKEEGGEAGN